MKKLKTNALMVRHGGKLGYTTRSNRPVNVPAGTLYEHVRLIDKQHSYVRINNVLYVARNKDLVLKEQVVQAQYPQQMADFAPVPQKNVSLDMVVDKYIVRYERESIPQTGMPGPGPNPAATPPPETLAQQPTPSTLEERQLRKLQSLLFEQDAPPDEPPGGDEPPPDEGGGGGGDEGGGGGSGEQPPGPPVVNTPKINLNDFSRSIARLINNYDALINPRSIILNRVEAYIKSNYDERTAKMFMQIMERNYGLHATNTEYTSTAGGGEFPTPYSFNAGGEGGQLGGGGGGD
jgi:hypothetical protein